MPTTYIQRDTASDLSAPGEYDLELLETTAAEVMRTISLAASATAEGYHYTDAGIPGADGVTGDYSVEVDIAVGDSNIQVSAAVGRVDSSGTLQQETAFSAEQTADGTVLSFSFTSVDLGTWATGDRLRVAVRYRNSHSHTSRSVDVAFNTVDSEVVAPWSAGATIDLSGSGANAADGSGDATATRGLSGSGANASDGTATLSVDSPSGSGEITLVGTPQVGAASNGGDVTLTFDVAPQEGDCVLLIGGNADQDGSGAVGPSTAGYTERHLHQANDGSNLAGGIWSKFLGATPDTDVVGQGSGVAQEATSYACIVLRGVDSAVLDVAVVEVGPGAQGESDPDPGAITTATDNAWVIACGVMGTSDAASAAPSGYSNLTSGGAVDTVRHATALATKIVATAGSEDPGPFSWANNASGFYWVFTAAIQPAATGAVSLSGSGANAADGQGVLGVTRGLSGAGANAATGSGVLTVGGQVDLSGSGANAADGSGSLGVTRELAGAGANTSAGTADASITRGLSGAGANASDGSGVLDTGGEVSLTGTGANASTGAGTLDLTRGLQGSGANASDSTGALALDVDLSGAGAAASEGSGDLTVSGQNVVTLSGSGANASTGSGSADVTRGLAGTGANAVTGSGAADLTRGLEGSGANAATAQAALDITRGLAGAGAAAVAGFGRLAALRALSGQGANAAAGSGVLDIEGPPSGRIRTEGSGLLVSATEGSGVLTGATEGSKKSPGSLEGSKV